MAADALTPGINRSALDRDARPPDRGWDGLARVLEALKPAVNTELDLTPSEITDRIEQLINRGKSEQAIKMVEQRQANLAGQSRGTDVQLMFQHARALAALGRADEAVSLYTEMTTRFPELPEPWNNLGALYAARGEFDAARGAVQMALRADPNYAVARANLADLQRILAAGGKGETTTLKNR